MLKPFSMIFFIAVMVWIGVIFVTSDPRTRIDRACLPITFTDSFLVAVVQIIHEPYAMGTHEMMLSVEYGCKFTVWKTFYEEREHAGQVNMPVNATLPKVQTQTSRISEQTEPAFAPRTTQADQNEPLTEVQVTSKPLPNYLDIK